MGPAAVNTLNVDRLVFMRQKLSKGIEKGTRARELAHPGGPKRQISPGRLSFPLCPAFCRIRARIEMPAQEKLAGQ
jgi:hypothetical protein